MYVYVCVFLQTFMVPKQHILMTSVILLCHPEVDICGFEMFLQLLDGMSLNFVQIFMFPTG